MLALIVILRNLVIFGSRFSQQRSRVIMDSAERRKNGVL